MKGTTARQGAQADADEGGTRVHLLRRLRWRAYRTLHPRSEPWGGLARKTARYARLGTATRCKVCGLSIRGPLGLVNRALWGVAPLSKHPDLCNVCRIGERLLEVTVLFADARGFTTYSEHRPPDEVAAAINKMFEGCIETLLEHDGLVDKLLGDAVMALFGAPIMRPDHREQAAAAALEIQRKALSLFPPEWQGACVRMGLNSGVAFVGRIGSKECRDYTAVGDVVNVAERLQEAAEPGEIMISADVYSHLATTFPDATPRLLTVRGREEPVAAYALKVH